jgi:hypothetical protein
MIYESSNAFSFPHATKTLEKVLLNQDSLKTPIVGKYNIDIINKPKGGYHFNKEKKLKEVRPKTPGPGKYNVNNETFGKCTPKFTIGKKIKDPIFYEKKKIPGPGTYNLTEENYEKTVGKKTLLGRFSKMPRLKKIANDNPGVGKYDLSYYDISKNKNKYTIPKSARRLELSRDERLNTTTDDNSEYSNIKGKKIPKFYQIKPLFGNEGTKPLIRGRLKEAKKLDTPGPGAYNVDRVRKKTPAASFGYGKKIDFEEIARKKNIPGPKYNFNSEFDISNKKKINAVVYKKPKKVFDDRYQTPGPGSYHIPCSFANTPLYQSINNKYRKI